GDLELRLRRLVRRSGGFCLAWHSCSLSTCYASHTKFLTGSRLGSHDLLGLGTATDIAEAELNTQPTAVSLFRMIEVLREWRQDTQSKIEPFAAAMQTRGALTDVQATQIATAYCAQRADLRAYYRMFICWQDTLPALALQRKLRRGLGLIEEVESYSLQILAVLDRRTGR
ncbi:hypothetical protein PRZ01_15125, partial [Paucibacter sp. hw1]|nr:hypothetical protein [Roseateles koreensis]